MVMKHNPLDGHADEEIKLKLEPLEVVVGHAIIAEIAKYFIPPKKSDKALDDLSAAAGSNFAKMTSGTRAGLEHALTKRKRLDLSIDIDAPLILIPQKYTVLISYFWLFAHLSLSLLSQLSSRKLVPCGH